MMRTSYDPEADAFYARFASDNTKVETTQEVAPGVMIDLDANGELVGVEVLRVRQRDANHINALVSDAAE